MRQWLQKINIVAVAQIASALATVFIAIITCQNVSLTQNLLKSQVEPLVDFHIIPHERELIIGNGGAHAILNVSVNHSFSVVQGPSPYKRILWTGQTGRSIKAKPWWERKEINPNQEEKVSFVDVVNEAVQSAKLTERDLKSFKGKEELYEVPLEDEIYFIISFTLNYDRDFDHRRFTKHRTVFLFDQEGEAIVWDIGMWRNFSRGRKFIDELQAQKYIPEE